MGYCGLTDNRLNIIIIKRNILIITPVLLTLKNLLETYAITPRAGCHNFNAILCRSHNKKHINYPEEERRNSF